MNDEIVCICRLEDHKRQHLLMEALRYCRTPVRLRLCGLGTGVAYAGLLTQLSEDHGLADRVTLEHRWISEEEKAEYLADCLAAAYLPDDEDSYGYPTIEAAHASKPVLTATDSGGPLEFVINEVNGLVSLPQPQALAAAMDRLYEDRDASRRMGVNANARIAELHIGWPHVLERLLA
jgi:glycosyltransferase involved in cell wall biosynthesis